MFGVPSWVRFGRLLKFRSIVSPLVAEDLVTYRELTVPEVLKSTLRYETLLVHMEHLARWHSCPRVFDSNPCVQSRKEHGDRGSLAGVSNDQIAGAFATTCVSFKLTGSVYPIDFTPRLPLPGVAAD